MYPCVDLAGANAAEEPGRVNILTGEHWGPVSLDG